MLLLGRRRYSATKTDYLTFGAETGRIFGDCGVAAIAHESDLLEIHIELDQGYLNKNRLATVHLIIQLSRSLLFCLH